MDEHSGLCHVTGETIGPYQVLAALGAGGMGVVYKARDVRLGRLVALKCLPSTLAQSGEARERSMAEARAIAALNHPNIATLYEVSSGGDAPVLVLEYLSGGTLRARIDAHPFAAEDIVEVGLQIADGLSHAHRHGVVHGDIKPENLMFTADGRLKITDFGVARFVESCTIAADPKISGTLRYMAPECLRGWPADCQSDIFSVGVVLEDMTAAGTVPADLLDVVARATARDRSERFGTIQDLTAAVQHLRLEKPRSHQTPTILVIEDDETLREVLELGLAREGYRVFKAASGSEGLRLAAEHSPHLILLDVTLPGLNGFDVCRKLRREGFNAPIMMITGKTEEVDRIVGLEIGADDYLTKPFGQRELVTRVRAHLRRAYDMDASRRFVDTQPATVLRCS